LSSKSDVTSSRVPFRYVFSGSDDETDEISVTHRSTAAIVSDRFGVTVTPELVDGPPM
jgi:hypothetical protein